MVHNTRMEGYVTNLTQESREILTDWLWADNLLYKYFLESHRIRVEQFEPDRMKQAVALLQNMNQDLKQQCVVTSGSGRMDRIFHPGNKKIQPMIPNKHKRWCVPFFKTEIAFTKSIRLMNRMYVRKHLKVKLKNRRRRKENPSGKKTFHNVDDTLKNRRFI